MQEYKLKITNQAKEQLRLIKNYLLLNTKDKKLTKKILKELKNEMNSLSFMPKRIKYIEEDIYRKMKIRKKIYKKYYIYFTLMKKRKKL